MFSKEQIKSLQDTLSQAKSIVIALPPNPSTDIVASGLGLYLSLKEWKDRVNIGCSSNIKVSNASLFGVNKIKTSIGNQNLIIKLNYPESKLDKIDYKTIGNSAIELHVNPRTGENAPTAEDISFHFSGANADLVFVLGINSLTELGALYADEKKFFDTTQNISLNVTPNQSGFSALSFHTSKATSIAEIIGYLLKALNLASTPDGSTNLLSSISEHTPNLNSPQITPDTLEIVAFLLRSGGKKNTSPVFGSPRPPAFGGTFDQTVPQEWVRPKIFRSNNNVHKPQNVSLQATPKLPHIK